jgi:hypothetical protein
MPALILPRSPHHLPSVTLRFVEDSGPRGVLDATVDGVTVPMLVHANAGFTVMLTHDALRRVNGTSVAKESDYGLGHDLRLSELGRGTTTLASLEVGGFQMTDVACSVFQLPTVNWDGMLGVGWLAAARPVVDFGSRTLSVPSAAQRRALDSEPVRFELRRDVASGRYVADLTVEGTLATVVVSTVAETILDLEFAQRSEIELTAALGAEHGPGGAVVPVRHTAHPVTFAGIGSVVAQVDDTYAYSDRDRPSVVDQIAGYLGADLLLAAGALLDFG